MSTKRKIKRYGVGYLIEFDDLLDEKLKKVEDNLDDEEMIKRIESSNGFPLSEEQLQVVREYGRPLSVVACAGAGKTSVMVSKMIYMEQIHKVKASSILGISFNKEAVENLKKRYKELRKGMGLSTIVLPSFNTFHSIFYSLLRSEGKYRKYSFTSEGEYTYKLLKKVKQTSSDEGNKKVLEDYFNIRGKLINEGYNEVYRSVINGDVTRTGISYLKDIDLQNFILVMSTYESIKEERQELDFEDMQLLLYEEVVKNENKNIIDRFRLVYQHVFIDEYQDINSIQIELLDKLMGKELINNLVTVGDSDQCQPPETLVSTPEGTKRIDELSDGDEVLSWEVDKGYVTNKGYPIKVSSRPYTGKLYTIKVGERQTKTTPNHKFLVRWKEEAKGKWVTYIMKRDEKGYRVGVTTLLGLVNLYQLMKNGKVWVLGVYDSESDAEEGLVGTEDLSGVQILEKYHRSADYPLLPLILEDNEDYQVPKDYFKIYASNILPDLMEVPKEGKEDLVFKGELVTGVEVEDYEGLVYSLDVHKNHNYVADGIVTLNSIYQFRGSNPDYIVNFILNYENAHRLFLGSNYRCKSNILDQIIPSITKNKVRVEYDMKAHNTGGEVIKVVGDDNQFLSELEKDLKKEDEETVILVRLNMQQKVLSDVLIENDIDVNIKNERSTVRNDIVYKDIMSIIKAVKYRDAEIMKNNSRKILPYLKRDIWDNIIDYDKDWIEEIVENPQYKIDNTLRKNINDLYNYTKTKNMVIVAYKMLKPYYDKISQKGYVSMKDVELIVKHMYNTSYELSLSDYLTRERIKESRLMNNFENGIGLKIQTMHSVKGLEFDNVYLYGLDNTIIPNEKRMKNMGEQEQERYVEEERRLFYVAWTRAKNRLIYHYTSESDRSMFIREIE